MSVFITNTMAPLCGGQNPSAPLEVNCCFGGALHEQKNQDQNNTAAVQSLIKECRLYNKSLDYKQIDICDSDGGIKQADKLDLSVFGDYVSEFENSNIDDEWGESDPMINFSVEEMFDLPTLSDVESVS